MNFSSKYLTSLLLLALPAVLFMGIPQRLHAQSSSLLRVIVLSEDDGSPMAGANVLLYGTDQNPQTERPRLFAVSDRDGLAEIRNVPPDTDFLLRVTSVGFATYEQTISLAPSERELLQINLKATVTEFDELVVEGEGYGTVGEAGLRRITTSQISRVPTPGTGGDLVSYLQTVPGVITSGDRGGDLYIRGGTPDQNQILVDGLFITKPFHISNLFSAFPDNVIQDVNMFAGGFGAGYADATSAVIDIGLRQGNMREHEFSASASAYLVSMHAEGPLQRDNQSYLLSARTSTIKQFAPALTGEDVNLQFSDLIARYSAQNENISCSITGIYTDDRGEIVPGRNVDQTWSNFVIGSRCLGYDEEFNYPFVVSAGYSRFNATQESSQRTERSTTLGQIYINADLRQELLNIPIDYGFGVNFKSYDTVLQERFTSLESFSNVIPVVHLYASAEWSRGRWLSVQPGIASQITLVAPVSFEPRLRIALNPGGSNRTEIGIAAGRYTQLNSGITDERDVGSVFTVFLPVEQGDPLPESLHGIVSLQQRFGNGFLVNLEGYLTDHRNIPVSKWNPEVGVETETALADGLSYGFDVRAEFNRSPVYLAASYGWGIVEYEAVSGDLGAWIREPVFSYNPLHDQRHKLNAIASYRFGKFTASARWEFGSGKPYTQIFGFDMSVQVPFELPEEVRGTARTLYSRPFGERLPVYHRLDVSLKREFQMGGGLSVEAEAGAINLYNRANIFNFDVNTLQRVDQTPLLPYLSVKLF
jgi:hypothetical protein